MSVQFSTFGNSGKKSVSVQFSTFGNRTDTDSAEVELTPILPRFRPQGKAICTSSQPSGTECPACVMMSLTDCLPDLVQPIGTGRFGTEMEVGSIDATRPMA